MFLKQYYLGCFAHASYLIADETTRLAAVVDPQRDIDQYLHDAEQYGLHIGHVFLTHFHADFLAGHLELHDRTGAVICLGARAQADYAFNALGEGDEVVMGDVMLKIFETPGHTPEGISILVYDLATDELHPHAVLTGDTLSIGDVGRPDLFTTAGMSAVDLAGLLYDSLHQKLLKLPDSTLVYPAHGAGSMCGKNLSADTCATLGSQRRLNYALQPMSKEAFIVLVMAEQPEAPPYFAYAAMLNRRQRPTLAHMLRHVLKPLLLEEVLRYLQAGAQVLDVRPAADFVQGHLRGSTNVGLNGHFATWVGTVLAPDRTIVIVAEPGHEAEAAMRLGRIGFDRVAGYLQGGPQAFAGRADLTQCTEQVTPAQLAALLASPEPPVVLDIRTPNERQTKQLSGSCHIPLNRLRQQIAAVPRDRKVVIHCASGYRSVIAASILEQYGIMAMDLAGGLAAWEAAGLGLATEVVMHV